MRIHQSILLCAATAAWVSVGCDSHEHEHYVGPAPTAITGDVSVDEPQGEVISGPGVIYAEVEPDPVQRVYVYDEGYPPGTYTYDNYYYYGGYRYPRDVFVGQYVQENVRQHRYVNAVENRQAGTRIEQKQRADFAVNHGRHAQPAAVQPARQAEQPQDVRPAAERPAAEKPAAERPVVERPAAERPEAQPHVQTPVRQHEAENPAGERPTAQPRVPTPARPPESEKPAAQRPDDRKPAAQEHPAAAPPANRPEQRPNGQPEKEKAPANDSHKPGGEDPKRDENK